MQIKKKRKKTEYKAKPMKEPIFNRQEEESDPAWKAFCVYRDLPEEERTITNTARALHKSRTNCGRWSVMWCWQKRIVAWENEKVADEMDNNKAQHAKAIKENITIARAFKKEVASYIKWFQERKMDMLEGMNPKDVVWIFQTMTSLERQMNEDLVGSEKSTQSEKEQIIFTFER